MIYEVIKDTTSDYGTRRLTFKYERRIYTATTTTGKLNIADLYNTVIAGTPEISKKQDVARARHADGEKEKQI